VSSTRGIPLGNWVLVHVIELDEGRKGVQDPMDVIGLAANDLLDETPVIKTLLPRVLDLPAERSMNLLNPDAVLMSIPEDLGTWLPMEEERWERHNGFVNPIEIRQPSDHHRPQEGLDMSRADLEFLCAFWLPCPLLKRMGQPFDVFEGEPVQWGLSPRMVLLDGSHMGAEVVEMIHIGGSAQEPQVRVSSEVLNVSEDLCAGLILLMKFVSDHDPMLSHTVL
jgi:hypothetical protein